MRLAVATVLSCSAFAAAQSIESLEPQRQFDFWVGEWDITNRFWSAGQGEAVVPGAQMRVEPVLDGTALVEHYRGTNWQGADILGFSMRAYDPEKQAWVILLNWPSTDAPFWTMEGAFQFNRGEFFGERQNAEGETIQSRYIFSDLRPGYYRWEGSQSSDGGATWSRPGYVMEGTRREEGAEPIDEAWLHGEDIDERCTGERRDQLDFMNGNWQVETSFRGPGGVWTKHEATLTSRPILAGCARMNTFTQGGDFPHESIMTLAYDAKRGAWVAYALSNSTGGAMQRYEGVMRDGELALMRTRSDGAIERLRWHAIEDDSYEWDHSISDDEGETWVTDAVGEFSRGD